MPFLGLIGIRRLSWAFACVILVLCRVANALLPSGSDSVELQASRADCVVTGIVQQIQTVTGPPATGYTPQWLRMTVRTTQRLLGDPGDVFICLLPDQTERYPNAAAVGDEALFVLARGSRYETDAKGRPDPWYQDIAWTTMSEGGFSAEWHSPPISLAPEKIASIETMELTPFTTREEMIEHLRPYCARPLPQVRVEALWNPYSYSDPRVPSWDLVIGIPVDAHAEQLARWWIDSPNDVLRGDGVRVLRHARSTENIQALKKVAAKPATTEEQDVARAIALSTLADWGEHVEWRRNESHAVPNGPGTVNFWLCAALVPLASIVYWRQSKKHKWRWRVAVSTWLFALSLLVMVLLRSFVVMDGFEYGNWIGGAVRGDAYLVWATSQDAPRRTPFLLENPRNMPALANPSYPYYDDSWDIRWDRPFHPFIKPFGIESADQDIYPTWREGMVFRMPLWLAILICLSPLFVRYGVRAFRRWRIGRATRRRGFPVVVDESL